MTVLQYNGVTEVIELKMVAIQMMVSDSVTMETLVLRNV